MKKGTIELIVYGILCIIVIIFGAYQWYLDIASKRAIIELGKTKTQFVSGENITNISAPKTNYNK